VLYLETYFLTFVLTADKISGEGLDYSLFVIVNPDPGNSKIEPEKTDCRILRVKQEAP
jgi:hypothetical protein